MYTCRHLNRTPSLPRGITKLMDIGMAAASIAANVLWGDVVSATQENMLKALDALSGAAVAGIQRCLINKHLMVSQAILLI